MRGIVQDASGGRIRHASIVVETVLCSLKRETASDDRGEFSLNELPPGTYQLTVTAKGFAAARSNVNVIVS
ncbi:MAG TPA: carboxypeptidase-like regulatory domain-containing protein, partial [Candidatus Acidoferrum sp.]|nr:carboxypeptidase-like regulatory domain-containing protein [Candidatus Acidoferrum sp.]